MIPSVVHQGFHARFIHNEPAVRNYNSGLIEIGGVTYIATRRFNVDLRRCDIVINKLVDAGVERVCVLRLPRAHGMESFEDARLFLHAGKVHVAYTEGRYWTRPWVAVQMLAILRDDWTVERVVTIGFGQNSLGQEKNWQFFSHAGDLHFVYSIEPHVVVRLDEYYRPIGSYRTEVECDEPLRGGTPPVLVGERYISFPHFHRPMKERSRRYGFCAYSFHAAPPFAVIGATEPLVTASEADPTLPNIAVPYWTPLVVFPCGAILKAGVWTVSAGINDSYDALFELPHARLNFAL